MFSGNQQFRIRKQLYPSVEIEVIFTTAVLTCHRNISWWNYFKEPWILLANLWLCTGTISNWSSSVSTTSTYSWHKTNANKLKLSSNTIQGTTIHSYKIRVRLNKAQSRLKPMEMSLKTNKSGWNENNNNRKPVFQRNRQSNNKQCCQLTNCVKLNPSWQLQTEICTNSK